MKPLISTLVLLHFSLLLAAQYAPGYYIDSSGNKTPGLLKYTFGGSLFTDNRKGACRLYYKKDSTTDKAIKFTAKDIKGFVIGSDSFTVIHDFRLNGAAYYPQDFCHVLQVGRIKLLQYDAMGMTAGPMATSYDAFYPILEKDNKGHLLNKMSRKNLEDLVAEDPELVEKIKNKELKFKDIAEIVREYNTYMAAH